MTVIQKERFVPAFKDGATAWEILCARSEEAGLIWIRLTIERVPSTIQEF